MTIKTTSNLSQFTFHDNRRISPRQVATLSHEIELHGQLTPIIVSPKKVITDGQHRFLAIKELRAAGSHVKLSYVVRNLSRTSIASLNSAQTGWNTLDWIEFHIRDNNKDYVNLQTLQTVYPMFTMSALASFTHDSHLDFNTKRHKTGDYKYSFDDMHEEILNGLVQLAERSPMFKQKAVLRAVSKMSKDPNFDSRRLFYKISSNLASITKQSGVPNWFQCLKYWYNKGLYQNKITIDIPSRTYQ